MSQHSISTDSLPSKLAFYFLNDSKGTRGTVFGNGYILKTKKLAEDNCTEVWSNWLTVTTDTKAFNVQNAYLVGKDAKYLPYKLTTKEQLYSAWKHPDCLLGIRPDRVTRFLAIDIDRGSDYHPANSDRIYEVVDALDAIGLSECVAVRSSDSGGMHLYFPFLEKVWSDPLAAKVTECLAKAGHAVKSGQLEIFPNVRSDKDKGRFNGLRMPLQERGSYLVDLDGYPIEGGIEHFLTLMDRAASCQDMKRLKSALNGKTWGMRSRSGTGIKLAAMVKDLKELCDRGFTGKSQTNGILAKLGRLLIITRGFTGQSLASEMEKIVSSMPGFNEFCGHIDDLARRCTDWARSHSRRYKPYQGVIKVASEPLPLATTNNQLKAEDASKRIWNTITSLASEGKTFASKSAFLNAIAEKAGASLKTIYKLIKATPKAFLGLLDKMVCKPAPCKDLNPLEHDSARPEENAVTLTQTDFTHCDTTKDVNKPLVSETEATQTEVISEQLEGNSFTSSVASVLPVAAEPVEQPSNPRIEPIPANSEETKHDRKKPRKLSEAEREQKQFDFKPFWVKAEETEDDRDRIERDLPSVEVDPIAAAAARLFGKIKDSPNEQPKCDRLRSHLTRLGLGIP